MASLFPLLLFGIVVTIAATRPSYAQTEFPCSNGGTLSNDGTCVCPNNWTGPMCEEAYCVHGLDNPVEDMHSFDEMCICDPGYMGERCNTSTVRMVHFDTNTACDHRHDVSSKRQGNYKCQRRRLSIFY
uniref:EGF-like domain-containing protein n=1 Tax=Plectus sambesii TaxID=2011161 RepID=A0A914W4G3_9BILA